MSEHLPNHYFTHWADCFMLFGLVHIKGLLHRCLCSSGLYWLLVVFYNKQAFFFEGLLPPPPLSLSLCCVSKYGPNPFCFKHQTHGNQRANKYGGGCFVLNFTSAICIAPLEDVRRLTAHPQSSPSIVITRFLKVVWAFCERQNVVFAPQCSYAKQYETHHRWEEKVKDRLVLSPVHLGLA